MAVTWARKQLSLRSSAICDLQSAIVCDRLRSYGNQPLIVNMQSCSQNTACTNNDEPTSCDKYEPVWTVLVPYPGNRLKSPFSSEMLSA